MSDRHSHSHSWGRISPVALVGLGLLLLGCIGGTGWVLSSFGSMVRERAETRRQERVAQDQTMQAVQELIRTGKLGDRPKFPDSPVGRLGAMSYSQLEKQLRRQQKYLADLEAAKWDKVLAAPSLRTKASLERSLMILAKVRQLTQNHFAGIIKDQEEMLIALKREAGSDLSANQFVEGARKEMLGPEGSMALNKKSAELLSQNHDAIEGMLRFLLKRVGRYSVSDDETVTFDMKTTDAELNAYNAFVDKQVETLEAVNAIDQKRLAQAQAVTQSEKK